MRLLPLLLVGILSTAALAQPRGVPVTDAELAAARGRFTLPSGQQLALAVRSDTSVDGQLVLRSVLNIEQTAKLSVFAPSNLARAQGQPELATASPMPVGATSPPAIVIVDPATGMPNIQAATTTGKSTISVDAASAVVPSSAGLQELPVVAGGPAIETPAGAVRVVDSDSGRIVSLSGSGLAVSQLLGPALGSVIANSSNNRTIDTSTTVDVTLSNMGSTLVDSAMLRVAGLVASTARTPF